MVVGELMTNVDVAIIGGGPGGYVAAIRCAQLGLDTLLVEKDRLGGICTNAGCIPSKALIHAANINWDATHSQNLGISAKTKIDFKKLIKWKAEVVDGLVSGIGMLCKKNGVDVVQGTASFHSQNEIVVQTKHGPTHYKFKNAIIATGSIPREIKGLERDHKFIIDSTDALELKQIPKEFVVYGAGYIGIEMAIMYAKLGSKVTIVYRGDKILRHLEPELGSAVQDNLKNLGINLRLNSTIDSWKKKGAKGSAIVNSGSKKKKLSFDKLLVAVGTVPYTESLNLEKTQVQLNEKGFIKINGKRQTTDPNIYAIGDVAGAPLLAHKAFREGKVVAEIIAGKPSAYDNVAIPLVVFSDPELASTGLGEKQAKAAGYNVLVSRFPLSASGKARTLDTKAGFVKLISDKDSGILLGAYIASPNASELISELSLAVEMAAQLEDVAATIHPHPTLSESIMEAAEVGLNSAVHMLMKKI
jgi:dihydrolipoamide dehydrogenase